MTFVIMVSAKSSTVVRQPISPKRIRLFKILLSVAGLLCGLLMAEGVLRLVEKIQLGDRAVEGALIKDPVLGPKLAPFSKGHDANGFRNDTVPAQVDIVALGDSQTWGVNVNRSDAWPQQLAKLSGRAVYSMSFGGFGPVQYKSLTPQALKLSPKGIIIGLYLGNDIYDAYHLAYQYDAHRNLRNNLAAAELTEDTVSARAESFWAQEKQFYANFGRSSFSGWSFWLRGHSALGRTLNRTGLWPGSVDLDYEIYRRWAETYPDRGTVCETPGEETVFTTAYRLVGLDLDEPRIVEGLRITKELLGQMQSELTGKNVKLMVVLVPTKETVYAAARTQSTVSNPVYQKLVQNEARVRSELLATCGANHIQCVDSLPYLTSHLERGERLYPTSTESHPNAHGYSVVASAVNENLVKLGW
jgi:lysophospholipase L1-like esterase